jgi:hypothetical protein
MNELHIAGYVTFQGRQVPFEFSLDVDAPGLALALCNLLSYPDDPGPLELPAGVGAEAAGAGDDIQPQYITSDDIKNAPTEARKWSLLAARFPELFAPDPALPQSSRPPRSLADIRKLEQTAETDPLELDLARLRVIAREELTKANNGEVNASEVARRLGYPTGGTKWGYVQTLSQVLQAEYDEQDLAEFTQSSSSTAKNAGPGSSDEENGRHVA